MPSVQWREYNIKSGEISTDGNFSVLAMVDPGLLQRRVPRKAMIQNKMHVDLPNRSKQHNYTFAAFPIPELNTKSRKNSENFEQNSSSNSAVLIPTE